MTNTIELYKDAVWGIKVSEHGLENGYLDYRTMAKLVGYSILNNTVRAATMEDWEMVSGEFEDCVVFQDYIISDSGYEFLRDRTDEIVFYNHTLDIYVWAITHFGTSWDYVLSDVKLINS